MGDKPAWCHLFRHEYEMKSLRSEQKTTNLSYRKVMQYIGATRKFNHLFNVSMLVLFKKYHRYFLILAS
jgi:hypothetical protein